MDILYQLPFPEDLCSKIFLYACKSPHTGLGVGIFKNKLQLMDLDIPDNDKDIISSDADKENYYTYNKIYLNLFTCLWKSLVKYPSFSFGKILNNSSETIRPSILSPKNSNLS